MRKSLKIILAVLAACNLIALFVFDYDFIHAFNPDKTDAGAKGRQKAETVTEAVPGDASIRIEVPKEPLVCEDGKTLDLSRDLRVIDENGNEADISVYTAVKPGSAPDEKIIEYSAKDPQGHPATAQRLLNLPEDYRGPSIETSGSLPSFGEKDLNSDAAKKLLLDADAVKALDGLGEDISDSVTVKIRSEDEASGAAVLTLTVTNLLNDTVSEDVAVPLKITGPVIKLTSDKVTVERGDDFNALEYVEYARDASGESLSSRIRVSGTVDTLRAGKYTVKFYVTDFDGNRSRVKTLSVTVK